MEYYHYRKLNGFDYKHKASSWYHIIDDAGNRIDTNDIPNRPLIVRDANDHSRYVEEGDRRSEMMATTRWERRGHQYMRRHYYITGDNQFVSEAHLTACGLWNSSIQHSFLYDTLLENSYLSQCHVHVTASQDYRGNSFTNCILTTSPDCGTVYLDGRCLDNCTVRGNFAELVGRSDLQRTAKNPALTQLASFEVHNNVVLKDCVITYLRRFIWRYRRRKEFKDSWRRKKSTPSPSSSPGSDLPSPQDSVISFPTTTFGAKRAGKQPLAVSDLYDAGEQLGAPLRRCEYSVVRVQEQQRPAKKRKIFIDLDSD